MSILHPNAWRRGLTAACALLLAATLGAAERLAFDIPAAPALETFKTFAEQSGVQLLYSVDSVKDVRTNAVKGSFTPSEAIRLMLADTGLDGQSTRSGAIAVNRNALPNDQRAAPRSSRPETTSDEFAEKKIVLDTFEVFGNKTLNMDIRRTRDDVQPYVVFSGDAIERSGATSLEDFFKTQLPMNSVSATQSQSAGSYLGATSEVNLRGLGANQTLILVDGRRLPSVNATHVGTRGFNQPDVNGIPLSAIERIEVLPTTASGIYGGAATGGVINIILKRNYSSVETRLIYENTFDTDVGSRRAEFTAGMTLEDGRTHMLVSASWSDSNKLLVGDRDFVQRARNELYARNPAAFLSHTLGPPAAHLTNLRNGAPLVNGVRPNLVLKNGVSLGSAFTFIPAGYAGPASDGGVALIANAGKYDITLPDTTEGARRSLLAAPTRRSIALNARRNFGSSLEAFIDLSHLENDSTTEWFNVNPVALLPASAPHNPFTTPIQIRFPAIGMTAPRHVDTETLRGVAGVIVRLPHDWMAAVDYGWSRARARTVSTLPTVGDPDGAGPGVSAFMAWTAGTLNIMRDLHAYPLDWTPYLLPSPNEFGGPVDTVLRTYTVRVGGPVFDLPAGPLKISALHEHRDEDARLSFMDEIDGVLADGVFRTAVSPPRSQAVSSYYVEARAPVFSNTAKFGLVHTLELQASVRRDDYETTGPNTRTFNIPSRTSPLPPLTYYENAVSATKWTAGLRYSPLRDVAMRASVGTGFLPPTITQVAPNRSISNLPIADSKRGGVAVQVPNVIFLTAGNPDLVAEQSESWSAGLVFTPRAIPGFRLSLDYTRIHKTDEIAAMNVPAVMDLEKFLPGRVKRAPLTPADAALGYTAGIVTELDATNLNLARTEAAAWDLQVDYTWKHVQVGELHFFSVATWQPRLMRQTLPDVPAVDVVSFTDGPLEWRANFGLNWNRGPWTLGWNMQYFDSRRSYSSTMSPALGATTMAIAGFDRSPTQVYHDVFARYRIGPVGGRWQGLLANSEIACGVQNVLNRSPVIVGTIGTIGGYDAFGDPRMSRYSISLKKRF
jgi:iron complex outermembrane recepter protein